MSQTILIIDDHAELRDMLNDMLMLRGFRVIVATNGTEGIQFAQEAHPDLIICDIAMPDIDGFQVLDAVRSYGQIADTPFLFLTASMTSSDEEQIIDSSANGFLEKPYGSADLYTMIDKLLVESA